MSLHILFIDLFLYIDGIDGESPHFIYLFLYIDGIDGESPH